HSEEIESLTTKILEKDEEILRLDKEVKKLMLENKELNVSLEWKDKKIKQLEDKIEELELDKTDLETKLNSVEAELTTVRKQVTKLKEENKSNQELNATLGENLGKMSKKVEEMASAMEKTDAENMHLKREIKKVQEIQIRAAFPENIPQSPAEQEIKKASFYLGEMCSRIQAMMYQSVLPRKYHHKKNYLVKYLEEDIAKIKDDEEKNEAERKWAELKKKPKWEDKLHKRTMTGLCEPWMKELKSRRNTTAHPTLSQKVLSESMAVMKKHDELHGWTEEQIVEDLIEMWKTLAEN
ncbi:unnamed protein product, partial [Porites lobata]